LSAENYDYLVGRAAYISDPLEKAWSIVKHSHYALDSVFSVEKELTELFDDDKKYSFEHRGRVVMKVYSEDFSMEYQRRLNGMQERRMRESILTAGSFWYTAWVNAGQPDLSDLKEDLSEEMKEEMKKNDEHFNKGKINGRNHGN
jgi:hypothetical protein